MVQTEPQPCGLRRSFRVLTLFESTPCLVPPTTIHLIGCFKETPPNAYKSSFAIGHSNYQSLCPFTSHEFTKIGDS